jgi:predicted ester cyclase
VSKFHGAANRLRAGSKVTAAQQDGADRFGEQEVDQMSEKENQNKRTVRRLYEEAGNEGRLEVLDEIAWPDHVEHNPFPGQTQGVEGLKQRISMVRAALDPRFTIEHLVAEGDLVAVMWSNQCAHVGEWFGFPPTGKSFIARGVDIHRCGTADWPSTGTSSTSQSSLWQWARLPHLPGQLERIDDPRRCNRNGRRRHPRRPSRSGAAK